MNDVYRVLGYSNDRPMWLIYLAVIGVCASGFLNFLVWSTSPAFRRVVCGDHETIMSAVKSYIEGVKQRIAEDGLDAGSSIGSGPRAPLVRHHQRPKKFGNLQQSTDSYSDESKQNEQLDPEIDSEDSAYPDSRYEQHLFPKRPVAFPLYSDSEIEQERPVLDNETNEDNEFF